MKNLVFKKGKATIRDGRKIVAEIYELETLFKGTRYEGTHKEPYTLQLRRPSMARECKSLEEVAFYLEEHTGQKLNFNN